MTEQFTDVNSKYNNLISKNEIEGAATTAFSKYKINPEANQAAMAQVKAKFSINGGSAVAMDGDKIETGANGNLTIDEFVSNMPECLKIQSKGGNGQGGNGHHQNANTTSQQKIAAGLGKLLPN